LGQPPFTLDDGVFARILPYKALDTGRNDSEAGVIVVGEDCFDGRIGEVDGSEGLLLIISHEQVLSVKRIVELEPFAASSVAPLGGAIGKVGVRRD
jgi:hypothetical protein